MSFVTDYVNGGELFTHLVQRVRFKEQEVALYSGEIVLALEHLHKVKVGFSTVERLCVFHKLSVTLNCMFNFCLSVIFFVAAWDCLSGPKT